MLSLQLGSEGGVETAVPEVRVGTDGTRGEGNG